MRESTVAERLFGMRMCGLNSTSVLVNSGASYCHECSDTSIKTYIDDFFESGHLPLSSFDHFKSHTDVERLDANEGEGVHFGEYRSPHDPDDASTVAMVTGTGQLLRAFRFHSGIHRPPVRFRFRRLLRDRESNRLCQRSPSPRNGLPGGTARPLHYPPRGRGVSRRLDENPRQIIEDATPPTERWTWPRSRLWRV